MIFGLASSIAAALHIKSIFIDYSQKQGAENIKISIQFFSDSVSEAGKNESFMWFAGTLIFLGATIVIPAFNIFQAWFHDDDFISEQKKLLKKINQKINQKIMALGGKI